MSVGTNGVLGNFLSSLVSVTAREIVVVFMPAPALKVFILLRSCISFPMSISAIVSPLVNGLDSASTAPFSEIMS